MSASTFKQRCLALLDVVAETGQSIIVTKHGRPVAKVVPLEEPDEPRSLHGSVTFSCDEEDLFSTGERWEADGSTGV